MKKQIILFTTLLITGIATTFGQVGIGTTNPNASSILDVESTTKGFLPPRMTTVQRNAIASPAAGLAIYNTTEKCLNFYNGSGWVSPCKDGANGGNIDYIVTQPVNYRLGGSGHDYAQSIQQTTDGGYIVAGDTYSSASGDVTGIGKGNRDVWIVKLDASGNITWQKNYGGSGYDSAYSIRQTTDGGYIVAGFTNSSASGDVTGINKGSNDAWILKLDANGNITWQKNYGGSSSDEAYSIQQTTDGGYVVAGGTGSSANGDVTGTSRGSLDYWIVKLDANGTITWQKNYGGSGFDRAYSIQQTTDGGYIVAGYTNSSASGDVTGTGKGGNDYWIVKLDASGAIAWQKNYGGSDAEIANSIQQTSDGGYIVAGETTSSASGDVTGTSKGQSDYWIVKLDASGNITWQKNYGGSRIDSAYSINQTSDGGYVVAGHSGTLSAGTGDQAGLTSRGSIDIWILTLDADGNIIP